MLKRTLKQKQALMAAAIAAGLVGLVVALLLATSGSVAAQTPVSGIISSPTTWGPPGNTFIVTGSVLVQQGVTLTIEEGVEVRFDQDKGLQIEGTLVAAGKPAQPIVFTSNQPSPAPGVWTFIRFTDTSTSAGFDPQTGAFIPGSGSILQHCEVRYGGGGAVAGVVKLESASPFIDQCTIEDNASTGIHATSPDDLHVTNNTITHNRAQGTAAGIAVIGGTVSIVGNDISDNQFFLTSTGAIGVWLEDTVVTLAKNTISRNFGLHEITNPGTGGVSVRGGTAEITDNVIEDNEGGADAGGLSLRAVTVATMEGNTIATNTARRGDTPGGILISGGDVTIRNNTLIGNS